MRVPAVRSGLPSPKAGWALDTGVGQGDVVRGVRTGGEGAGEQEEEFGER